MYKGQGGGGGGGGEEMALWWIQAETRASSNTAHTHPSVRVVSRPEGRKSIEGGRGGGREGGMKSIQGASHSSSLDALGREEEHAESIPLSLPRCSSEEEHRGREEEYPGSISFSLPRCSFLPPSGGKPPCRGVPQARDAQEDQHPLLACVDYWVPPVCRLRYWFPVAASVSGIYCHTHTHTHTHAHTHTHTHTHTNISLY